MSPSLEINRCEVVGYVEVVTPFRIAGWAMDLNFPDIAVDLALQIDGEMGSSFRPQYSRPALNESLGACDDKVGLVWFEITPPPILADGREHRVAVVAVEPGTVLPAVAPQVRHDERRVTWSCACQPLVDTMHRPAAPQVSVVVLSRNGSGLLNQLFTSWQEQDRSPFPVEWIVIDHGSSDDSLKLLDRWSKQLDLRVVALDRNDSFSASCNLGATLANAPNLLFMNNDIRWCMDALPQMLHTLGENGACAVGLKLMKPNPAHVSGHEVQHLGVRFKLREQAYWPYEAGTEHVDREAAHSAQRVPAATAAVLLVRRDDFLHAGGFHNDYFYGFEDVELCLRLERVTGRPVVCRNDLTALHHHGHTRLTGRESSIFERLMRNESVLQQHVGAWLKRQWWISLVSGDRSLCNEPLVIGLAGATNSAVGGGTSLAHELAHAISRACPHARMLLLSAAPQAHDLRDIHVLVALGPNVNLLAARHRRADLLMVAWADRGPDVQRWARSVESGAAETFDVCLARSSTALQAALDAGFPSCRSTPDDPLGYVLTPRLPLRLSVMPAARAASSARRASALVARLRAQGALAHLHDAQRPRLAEVVLHLGRASAPLPGSVNLLCMSGQRKDSAPRPGFHGLLGKQPTLAAVRAVWESVVGPLVPAP
jgi:GT2 family glycosyltransferase